MGQPMLPVGPSQPLMLGMGLPQHMGQPPLQPNAALPPPLLQQPNAYLVYDDEGTSMEEKRAEHSRYRYDEERIKQQMKSLEQSIEYRVSMIGSRIGL